MCAGAVSRSVALAYLLKYHHGHDALAISYEKNSPATIAMLCEWADRVITVMPKYAEHIPMAYKHKLTIYNVGLDRWVHPMHPELHALLEPMIKADPLWQS
jgi:hypothetical protein